MGVTLIWADIGSYPNATALDCPPFSATDSRVLGHYGETKPLSQGDYINGVQ